MSRILTDKMMDDAWRVFQAHASVTPGIGRRIGNSLEAPLADEFKRWSHSVPELRANPNLAQRTFVRTLDSFAPEALSTLAPRVKLPPDTAAVAYRLYLENSPAFNANSGTSPLVHIAEEMEARGEQWRADLAWRRLFATGEEDPRIDAAIDRITERMLASGIECTLGVGSAMNPPQCPITSAGAMRALLEWGGSRVTLADLMEVGDFGSPAVKLKRIWIDERVRNYGPFDTRRSLDIFFAHRKGRWSAGKTSYNLQLPLTPEGKPDIRNRNIHMDDSLRRFGFGTRSLLSAALFCMRHGVESWDEVATNLGSLTWHRMGAKIDEGDLRSVRFTITQLIKNRTAPGLDLSGIDFSDPASIATIILDESQIASRIKFQNWLTGLKLLDDEGIYALASPYPVGELALRATKMSITYDTFRTLDILLDQRMPARLERFEASDKNGLGRRAATGFAAALERGRTELALQMGLEMAEIDASLLTELNRGEIDAASEDAQPPTVEGPENDAAAAAQDPGNTMPPVEGFIAPPSIVKAT